MDRDNEVGRILRGLADDAQPSPWHSRARREAIEHKRKRLDELLPAPVEIQADPADSGDVARADALILAKQIGRGRVSIVSGSTGEPTDPDPITRAAILRAADSLETAAGGPTDGTRKRGRYRTAYDAEKDAKWARDWAAAKAQGVQTIREFARDRGADEITIREALERHRGRQRRAGGG